MSAETAIDATDGSSGPSLAASDWVRRHSLWLSVVVLGLLAYPAALSAAPGRMPSDSKLYVYLNPGRFLSDTTTTFDPRQFAGWVPHQHIAYLWPTGPWFWCFDRLGVPDWIAHRLWIGTLCVVAGLGVRWMARVLGLAPIAALVAAIVYQLSPYLLPYVSRTSVLLLPWAGLGWIVGCTVLAAARGRWRYPALIAVIVLTVGAVNATALAMIIPAPALWLVHAAWRGDIAWMRAVTTGAKVALLSTVVSLWWIVMLVIQGRDGADVLAYSESLASVSFTSTSTEVVRGLGYWLFYIRDGFGATTAASLDYMASGGIIAIGALLLACCLVGLVATRWAHRRYAAMLVGAGTILAVGVHPIDDPSPAMSVLVGDGEGGLALALRSSSRAVPVMVLGMALGAAMFVSAARTWSFRMPVVRRRLRLDLALAAVVALLAVANLPALWNGGFVDPGLERDQDPPDAWLDAATALDALPSGYRVLQLPGTEFGAYRWGYTVDQPLPALTERPLVTRDLLPLGSAPAMDLAFALDDRFQDGIAEVASIAPVARLLGVDTVWVTGDIAFDRFRLARPELVDDLLTGPDAADAGLLAPDRFGAPVAMVPDIPMVDERSVSDPRIASPISPVSLVGVADPVPTVRVKTDEVVLSGDGAGIVDAAAAGVIDGDELLRYSGSLHGGRGDADLTTALRDASRLVVTDSNRDRAHHWRSSQDVTGFTEAGGPENDVLRFESGDQRLPVFDSSDPSTQTISEQNGPVHARASAYGEPFAYLPEHRPVMAVDGNPATSWTVADRSSPLGEFIVLDVDEPFDHVTLRQPDTSPDARSITAVDLTIGDRPARRIELDATSREGDGQRIDVDPTTAPTSVTITIAATTTTQPPIGAAIGGVGFAEIDLGLGPTIEFIRPPIDGLTASSDAPDTPVSVVLTRLRVDPTDRWRSDPEPVLRRRFPVDRPTTFDTQATVRLDQRASGSTLATLLGERVVDDAHLTGVPTARGAAAFDGDASTSWITPFGEPTGHQVTIGGSGTAQTLRVTQPAGDFSPVTELTVTDADGSLTVAVPGDGAPITLDRPVSLDGATVAISAVEPRTTIDRRFGEPVVLPAAISEVDFEGASLVSTPTATVTATCRDDLLSIDGEPVGVSFVAETDALLRGDAVDVEICDPPATWDVGDHDITTTSGALTGFQVDRIVLTEGPVVAPTPVAVPTITHQTRTRRDIVVPACPSGCWLVFGEGYNPGWTASTEAGSLGPPRLVDGNANGWYIEPSTTPLTVHVRWTAQRTLNIAFALSALGVLGAVALVVIDRRRDSDARVVARVPTVMGLRDHRPRRALVATVVAAAMASALFVGWPWAVGAVIVGAIVAITRRTRVMGAVGVGIVVAAALVVLWVVRSERPYPNAGWPIRFEWLHHWTLFGIVLITCAALFSEDAARRDE